MSTGYLLPFWFQQFRYDNGLPLGGGKIYTFVNQTNVPKAVYADIDLETPLTNPIVLDSAGYAPQMYLAFGIYTFVIYDKDGNLISTRDFIQGAVGSNTTSAVDDHLVLSDATDSFPGNLITKLQNSTSINWTVISAGDGNKIQGTVTSGIGINKVSVTSSDTSDYLGNKFIDSSTIDFSISANKIKADYIGPALVSVDDTDPQKDYLGNKLSDGNTITWTIVGDQYGHKIMPEVVSAAVNKVMSTSSDSIAGYLEKKIVGGTGIVMTQTTDAVNGTVIHINNTAIPTNLGITTSSVPFSAALSIASSTSIYNVAAITLSAGSWLVNGMVSVYSIAIASAGNFVQANANISDVPNTIVYDGYDNWSGLHQSTTGATETMTISQKLFVVPINTTKIVYLCSQNRGASFSSGLMWGNILARQIV